MTAEQLLNRNFFKTLNKNIITDRHKDEINKILKVYVGHKIGNRLQNIYDFIKYNVDGDWVERIDIIRTIIKSDTASDYSLEIRYGKENIELVKKERYPKYVHTLEGYINKYGEVEGNKKYVEYRLKTNNPWGLTTCINKYGEVEGNKKWLERLNKKINTQNEIKKIKPYRNGRTLFEYQNRYGIKEGYDRWLERNRKQSYRFSKKYYINTYGKEIGNEMWGKYVLSMNKTSLKSFIHRYGDKIGKIKFLEFTNKIISGKNSYSKVSQELFWKLLESIDKKDLVFFAEHNGEEIFYTNDYHTIMVDFKYNNNIIEFDGDYWHSSEKQKELDKKRDEFLNNASYRILRIKEFEYYLDKNKIVNDCIKFLNDET